MTRTRLMVVSEQRLFRECLVTLLSEVDRFHVVGHEGDLEHALRRIDRRDLDIVLLDLVSQGRTHLKAVDRLSRVQPSPKIVVLGVDEGDPDVLEAIEAGANGYVARDASIDQLYRAIDLVRSDEASCSPHVAFSMFSRLTELSQERRRSRHIDALALTPRELEILELLAEGLSNKTIAARLSLSIYTIKNHVHRILRKLGVKRRSEAVDLAYRRRWLRRRRHGGTGA